MLADLSDVHGRERIYVPRWSSKAGRTLREYNRRNRYHRPATFGAGSERDRCHGGQIVIPTRAIRLRFRAETGLTTLSATRLSS